MRRYLFVYTLALGLGVLSSCDCTPPASKTCEPGCGTGMTCVDGVCRPGTDPGLDATTPVQTDAEVLKDDGGLDDDGGTGTVDTGVPGKPDATANIDNPDNTKLDTDCDGLSDAEEFANFYGKDKLKSDPDNSDTDGDGIPDGAELGRQSSPDPTCAGIYQPPAPGGTITNPTSADTDGDGIPDGVEDANHNGRVDPGETDPSRVDTDGDGLPDGVEDRNHNGKLDPGETNPLSGDSDKDGVADGDEDKNHDGKKDATETDPLNPDTDGDGCSDGVEIKNGTNPLTPGDCNGADIDTDHDGIKDQTELRVTHTDPTNPDTDGDGLKDGQEDKNQNGKVDPGETDPLSKDTDCDGVGDYQELYVFQTDPANPDTDGDGLKDGIETGVTVNPDPLTCPNFVADADPSTRTNPLRKDSDCDGLLDGEEDANHNGKIDPGESNPMRPDSDGDGLTDGVERGVSANADPMYCVAPQVDSDQGATKTDPTKADSDLDGLLDGQEDVNHNGVVDGTETDPNSKDTDCDGVGDAEEKARGTNPTKADTDGDGLSDGVELGVCISLELAKCQGKFVPDGDCGATRSDPLRTDTDGDGLPDGVEDKNKDGQVNPGETNPNKADTDGDGLSDGIEDRNHDGIRQATETDPLARDTDGDGLLDGAEDRNHNGVVDATETDPLKADTDGDTCSDGYELSNGLDPLNPGDCSGGALDADHDGIPDLIEQTVTHTDAHNPDTDGDGLLDGDEDKNQNGVIDPGETDPNSRDTDCDGLDDYKEVVVNLTNPQVADSDGDGLPDGLEAGITVNPETARCFSFVADADSSTRTNPLRKDTDCDGLLDGLEDVNHNGKVDPGETDPLRKDSDGDGLSDGQEAGICANADPANCAAPAFDADCGATKTDATKADTDGDGIADGTEDANKNGRIDANETDPASKDTDCDGLSDADEIRLGTKPTLADTDGDGLADGLEMGVCTSPEPAKCAGKFVADADCGVTKTDPRKADTDGDGLSDSAEDKNKNGKIDATETDPTKADTDGDGLNDSKEFKYGTNPLVADTDGDGIPDGQEDWNQNGVFDPGETNALVADTDGDGCKDGDEDLNHNHVVDPGETNPLDKNDCGLARTNKDSDCDGLTDVVEAALGTNPNNPDTDGDGLYDGREVGVTLNPDPATCPNAAFMANVFDSDPTLVTNPLKLDTDCDGIPDGVEDANHNGKVDPGETDPTNPDTDNDGLIDGIEAGVCTAASGCTCARPYVNAACPAFIGDRDCGATTTSATTADTDGDGIADGTEDANQNGRVDPGELDPNNPNDATPTDIAACATANLKPIRIIDGGNKEQDISFAVSPDFTAGNTATITVGGVARGVMVFDPALQVVGFALKISPALTGVDVNAQVTTLEALMAGAGAPVAGTKFVQSITTWDGYSAMLARYGWNDSTASDTVGVAANHLVNAILPGAGGPLSGSALGTETGTFLLKLEVISRSANTSIVVGALTKNSSPLPEARTFRTDDITNGSALGQFGDTTAVQCDRMLSVAKQPIDFVWVVDNSGSMSNKQGAVSAAATSMATQLGNSTIDWRLAVITSDLDMVGSSLANWDAVNFNASRPKYCSFTRVAADFQTCMGKLGINGSGSEWFFGPAACLMGQTAPPTPWAYNCGRTHPTSGGVNGSYQNPPGNYKVLARSATEVADKFRSGAMASFIFLTDTNEQSDGKAAPLTNMDKWVAMFSNFDGASVALSKAFVGGIVCHEGTNCGDGDTVTNRWPTFFTRMSGVYGDIALDADVSCPAPDNVAPTCQQKKIAAVVELIIEAAIGQASPFKLTKPPVSATIKVATDSTTVGACNANDIPRSRVNGFDYDGANRALKFYGNCRPNQDGKRISVSYRYWNDRTPDPDGGSVPCGGPCPAPLYCDTTSNKCVCPLNCDGTCGGKTSCNTTTCACACRPDCGGCPAGTNTCTTGTCSCSCVQNQTCGTGYLWKSDQASGICGCVCDAGALGCPAPYQADLGSCTCQCPANCGGTCVSPKVCDPLFCSCGCDAGIKCATGKKVDPATCGCVCDTDVLFCAGNQLPNTTTCSCDCKSDCGGCLAGYKCDTTACTCKCDPLQTCPAGKKLDLASCSCVCDTAALNCQAPLVTNAFSCSCACPSDCGGCAAGLVCNTGTCACECPSTATCALGYKLDPVTCACACDAVALSCPAGYEADLASCSCKCKDCGGCTSPKVCDKYSCSCGCDLTTQCGPGKKLDLATCTCVCDPTSIFCGSTEEPDVAACGCKCKSDCGGCMTGFVCDTASCGCKCDTARSCGAQHKVDPASCSCVCDPTTLGCQAPLVADATSCSCVCAPDCGGCGPGLACNPTSCACECPSTTTCAIGYKLDPVTCGCVCDTAALGCGALGPTYQADPASCGCVCKPNCGGCTGGGKCDISRCKCSGGPT
ncbi:MAG TPA: adventurous gliding motility lipoprotein CglD [Propionicimonas sp.]